MRDQVVLITGAASGIGAATAHELLRRGAVPVLVDCDAEGLAHTAASLGGGTGGRQGGGPGRAPLTVVADVSDAADCEAAVAATLARHGRIDVVWANAGIAAFGPLALTDPTAWRRCFEVNVFGVFNTVRAALPAVLASRGYVAVSASVSAFAHAPALSAYAGSKAAVEAACDAWRIELAAHGVQVGVIYASWVATPLMTEGALHPAFQRLRDTMPRLLSQSMSPEQAARLIADGLAQRRSRIWIPSWVRLLYALRALLHVPQAEAALRAAAPDVERLYAEGVAMYGARASSFGPRALVQEDLREGQRQSAPAKPGQVISP